MVWNARVCLDGRVIGDFIDTPQHSFAPPNLSLFGNLFTAEIG